MVDEQTNDVERHWEHLMKQASFKINSYGNTAMVVDASKLES
jgi:hypothetical protein